jgi:hypothetical protein
MGRTISRTLLNKARQGDVGPRVTDTENFIAASLQLVYSGKRVSVAFKGTSLAEPEVEATIKILDSLGWKSGPIVLLTDWPPGYEEIWAEVLAADSDVSLYFFGRD